MNYRNFRLNNNIIILITVFFLSSCATKIVSHPINNSMPAKGIAYNLPATELSYSMTLRLKSCDTDKPFEIIDATLTKKIVADRKNGSYMIDPTQLSNWSKTIPLAKFEINEGLLTHVSYQAKDETANIIKNTASLVGEVAMQSFLPVKMPLPSIRPISLLRHQKAFQLLLKQDQKKENLMICNHATKVALDEYIELTKNFKLLKKNLRETQLKLSENIKEDNDRKKLRERNTDIKNSITDTEEQITKIEKLLTIQYIETFIPNNNMQSFKAKLDASQLLKWLNFDDGLKELEKWAEENTLTFTISECAPSENMNIGNNPASNPSTKDNHRAMEYLFYKIPALCKLIITKNEKDYPITLSTKSIELMQYGKLSAIEIKNGAFQDNSHDITFDEKTGELKSFEFKDNKARAVEAIGGVTEATKIAGSIEENQIDKALEIEKKRKEYFTTLKETIEAQKKVEELINSDKNKSSQ